MAGIVSLASVHWRLSSILTAQTVTSINPDTQDFQWFSLPDMATHIPDPCQYWIHLPGSLTQALRERTEAFSVQVTDERLVDLVHPPESLASSSPSRQFWSRKVRLMSGSTPWVIAHTLIPQSSLDHGLQRLTDLSDRPLGELLFTTAGVRKDRPEVARTPLGWARRARFWLEDQPLLVTEIFMEALINHEQQRLSTLP
ncbi:MAG: chorismate lyase [Saccharospirillum sp.]|nr:chorismate lyase [Saccharospirillum sp.]